MLELTVDSPLGPLSVQEKHGCIVSLRWRVAETSTETPVLTAARDQLRAYFDGDRQDFDLPLAPAGSDHQKRVWDFMCAIPYGQTRSYGDCASAIGSAPRAVGGACGANPIPIIIPCHRILAAGGRAGGYSGAGGLETKAFLLKMEAGEPVLI